jgi:hypothetical protein
VAPPRTYDKTELKRLLRLHPEWSLHQFASALTEHNAQRGEPRAVNPHTVGCALSSLRPELEAEGLPVYWHGLPQRGLANTLKANTGRALGAAFHGHKIMVRLRQVDRLRQGEEVKPPDEARWALNWEARLRAERKVVDIDEFGKPYIREALAHELDTDGKLIDIIAQPAPVTAGDAARLAEAEKAIARYKAEADSLRLQVELLQKQVNKRPRRRTG